MNTWMNEQVYKILSEGLAHHVYFGVWFWGEILKMSPCKSLWINLRTKSFEQKKAFNLPPCRSQCPLAHQDGW